MPDGRVRDTLLSENDERRALRESVGKLVGRYGRSYFQDVTRRGARPEELWADLGQAGFLGVHLPEEHGGGGGGLVDLAIVIEETASQGCPLFMLVISPAIAGSLLAAHGSPAQQQEWLPGIAEGTKKVCFAITEPDAGTNTHNITTTGHRDGDGWRLRGQKYWTSGIDEADAVLVVARGPEPGPKGRHPISLFLVPTDAPGLSFQKIDSALQIPENQFTTFFDDVAVPPEGLVGTEGADPPLVQFDTFMQSPAGKPLQGGTLDVELSFGQFGGTQALNDLWDPASASKYAFDARPRRDRRACASFARNVDMNPTL